MVNARPMTGPTVPSYASVSEFVLNDDQYGAKTTTLGMPAASDFLAYPSRWFYNLF